MARALCGCRVPGSRRERQRAGKLFLPSGDRGREKGEAERRKGGNSGRQQRPNWWPEPKGPGSIWKATLCLALYCTPCCFNQWQACSQSLEQQRLFLIVSLLLPLLLLHYTATLLTKSLKSCAALSRPLRKPAKWMRCGEKPLHCVRGKSSCFVMMI